MENKASTLQDTPAKVRRVFFQDIEQWVDLPASALKIRQIWPGCTQAEVDDTLINGSYSAYRVEDEPGPLQFKMIFAYDFVGDWAILDRATRRAA